MKHRYNRQQRGLRAEVEHRRRNFRHRVEHRRTVLIEHALGITRRAAGVAQHAWVTLVTGRPFIIAVLRRHQRLVTAVMVENDIMLDRLQKRF